MYWGDEELVELFIDNGANMNARAKDGHTPLHSAVYANNIGIVRLLVARGANQELKDIEGRTPLHWAAGRGRKEIVKFLLDNGVDVNARAKEPYSPS